MRPENPRETCFTSLQSNGTLAPSRNFDAIGYALGIAVQSSDDASFFGGEQSEPSFIQYCFFAEHLPAVRKGLKTCRAKLGDHECRESEEVLCAVIQA